MNKNIFNKRICGRMAEMRKKAGITKAKMAGAMGVSENFVSAIEGAVMDAEVYTLLQYCNICNEKIENFLSSVNDQEVKKTTLYDYLLHCESDEEITVWDTDWDMETYFYTPLNEEDDFHKAMKIVSQCVDVCEIRKNGVEVNFYDVIKKSRNALIAGGFYRENQDADDMMEDVDKILAGNLSEEDTLKWAEIIYAAVSSENN